MKNTVICQEKRMYLAGGITGLTYHEAVFWRQYVERNVPEWLKVMSPMRAKGYIKDIEGEDGRVKDQYASNAMSTSKAIMTRDRNDVKRSDAVFVNFLKCPRVSIGTVMEIAWADAWRIPVIIVMEKDNCHVHSMVTEAAGYVVDTLDEGIYIATQLLRTGN